MGSNHSYRAATFKAPSGLSSFQSSPPKETKVPIASAVTGRWPVAGFRLGTGSPPRDAKAQEAQGRSRSSSFASVGDEQVAAEEKETFSDDSRYVASFTQQYLARALGPGSGSKGASGGLRLTRRIDARRQQEWDRLALSAGEKSGPGPGAGFGVLTNPRLAAAVRNISGMQGERDEDEEDEATLFSSYANLRRNHNLTAAALEQEARQELRSSSRKGLRADVANLYDEQVLALGGHWGGDLGREHRGQGQPSSASASASALLSPGRLGGLKEVLLPFLSDEAYLQEIDRRVAAGSPSSPSSPSQAREPRVRERDRERERERDRERERPESYTRSHPGGLGAAHAHVQVTATGSLSPRGRAVSRDGPANSASGRSRSSSVGSGAKSAASARIARSESSAANGGSARGSGPAEQSRSRSAGKTPSSPSSRSGPAPPPRYQPPSSSPAAGAINGWKEQLHARTGRTFWLHVVSGKVVWGQPSAKEAVL